MAKKLNQKVEITNYLLKTLNIDVNLNKHKRYYHLWWKDPRIISKGGMLLTPEGYNAFTKAQIKEYRIICDEKSLFKIHTLSAKQLIKVNKLISFPWFLIDNEIAVFDERSAVQLILFGGDLTKYIATRARIEQKD